MPSVQLVLFEVRRRRRRKGPCETLKEEREGKKKFEPEVSM